MQGQAEAGTEPSGWIPNRRWQWQEPKRPVPIPGPAGRRAKWLGQVSPSRCAPSSACLICLGSWDKESPLTGYLQDAKAFRYCCQINNRLGNFNTGEGWAQAYSPLPLVKPEAEVLIYSNSFLVASPVLRALLKIRKPYIKRHVTASRNARAWRRHGNLRGLTFGPADTAQPLHTRNSRGTQAQQPVCPLLVPVCASASLHIAAQALLHPKFKFSRFCNTKRQCNVFTTEKTRKTNGTICIWCYLSYGNKWHSLNRIFKVQW